MPLSFHNPVAKPVRRHYFNHANVVLDKLRTERGIGKGIDGIYRCMTNYERNGEGPMLAAAVRKIEELEIKLEKMLW